MKVSGLWASVDPISNRPLLKSELERTQDAQLKADVIGYLCGGAIISCAAEFGEDNILPWRGSLVPTIFFTDGEWLWSGEELFYLESHNILPQADFLEHMRAHDFVPSQPSLEAVDEAIGLLLDDEMASGLTL